LVGPLEESYEGFKYFLSVKDDLSKFVCAIPLVDQTAEQVAQALVEKVFLIFSFPEIIVSDNATNFNSNLMKSLCKFLKIKKLNTSIYHPQSNIVERVHSDLKKFLRILVEKDIKNWSKYLPYAVFNYNCTINDSTKFSPFNILFGKVAKLPNVSDDKIYTYDDYVSQLKFIVRNIQEAAKLNCINNKLKSKKYYDKNTKKLDLQVGESVLMKTTEGPAGKSFQKRWKGPFTIIQILSEENVKILVKNKEKVVHKNLLKKYFENESSNEEEF
jgi:hypothetical protein